MAAGEDPIVERTVSHSLTAPSSPTIPEESHKQSKSSLFRSQYFKLHRSQSTPLGRVHSLRSRFEQSQEEGPHIESTINAQEAALQVPSAKPEELLQEEQSIKVILPQVPNKDNTEANRVKTEEKQNTNLPQLTEFLKGLSNANNSESKSTSNFLEKPKVPEKPKATRRTVLKKSLSADNSKPQKRVSFSLEKDELDTIPVPKPRRSLIQQVTISETIIRPEILVAEAVIVHDPEVSELDNIVLAEPEERHRVLSQSPVGSIDNIAKILDSFTMDTSVDSKKKRSQSFRTKFRNIFSKEKDKKPKEKDDNKKTKKTDNVVFADNAQNESFNRHSTVRHTVDVPRREVKPMQNHQLNQNAQQLQQFQQHQAQLQNQDLEQRYAAMHINNYQKARDTFVNIQQQPQMPDQRHPFRKMSLDQSFNPSEDYVCMDQKNETKNYINVPKYDSSSTNTVESENSTTSINPLQQIQQERLSIRSKFFNDTTTTPPRAQDTSQNIQLVNPKVAAFTERPLINSNFQPQLNLNQEVRVVVDEFNGGYGTVFDRRPGSVAGSDVSSMSSPRSVEGSKLKLPMNREKIELQPRIKSPIPHSEVSTDKLIATELLKNSKIKDKKDNRSSPSHQKLQLEIDYPEPSLTESNIDVDNSFDQSSINLSALNQSSINHSSMNQSLINHSSMNQSSIIQSPINFSSNQTSAAESRENLMEAADWQRVQRDIANSPSLKNVQITTNALVHVDSSQRASTPSQDGRSRSVTPVMTARSSTTSLQRSPPKHEIRQTVEAFCWKELKKLKEKQDQQMQMLLGPMISSCGYAEDPIRRSRSMAVTPRDPRRSTSLPREIRQRRTEDHDLHAKRMAQQQRFNGLPPPPQRNAIDGNGTRPIFNRGSLTQPNIVEQPIYNKKVSFHSSQSPQNSSQWPTKNGFTQSPPQRRLDGDGSANDDEVFLPNSSIQAVTNEPSRNDIFLLNQQRQKELLLAKAQRNNAPVQVDSSNSRSSPVNVQTADGNSVNSDVLPMRNIREPIYGSRPPLPSNGYGPKVLSENSYGTRNGDSPGSGSRAVNENIYGTYNAPRMNESTYGSRGGSINESLYGTRPSVHTINTIIENPYGTRVANENPYGTRQNSESVYGSRPPSREAIYASRPGNGTDHYGTRPSGDISYNRASNESPYGIQNRESPYGTRPVYNGTPIQEPIYGTKHSAMVAHEALYGTRPGMPREPIYGSRPMSNRTESQYGMRPPGPQRIHQASSYQENIYGSRANPNAEGVYGSRMSIGSTRSEAPYNQQYYNRPRQMVPYSGSPVRGTLPGLQRSNSLRQPENQNPNQSLYAGRPNYSKPPSGMQLRQRPQLDLSPNSNQGRYDIPPDSPPNQPTAAEPIYGRKQTVSNKVCDMYGNIHDAGTIPPMSPPSNQKAGVLYGQLQRNSNAPPPVYQSYQHMQPTNGNFPRGTRLTASVNDMNRYHSNGSVTPPTRPLPPIPDEPVKKSRFFGRKKSESKEEEWNSDGKRGGLSGSESGGRSDTDGDIRSRSSRNNRRDDPRRHTLAGEQYGMSGQGGPLSRTMDLEGQPRGYPPPSNAMLFDDDPGIMSEVETSSTGFRRGGKQRSSLPVVRTPSKTLERPLGLVFLQYRNETKRALLPNEITSIDTVKALFVRSFPKQLTMEYLDSPQVKIYIHDSSKDMFYELEDLRSHLREIRDRSVLRLFESADVTGGLPMAGIGIAGGAGVPHFEDPSYFSEPEFDSEYQHQHIHKSKGSAKGTPYYIGSTASLPRAGLLRAYSPAVGNLPQDRMKTLPTGAPPKPQRAYSSGTTRSGADGGVGVRAAAPDRFAPFAQRPNNSLYNIPDGYMSSPERGSRYEEAYYSQYGTRSGSITPVIDEEVSDTELIDDQYSIYGVKIAPPGGPRPAPRTQFSTPAAPPYDATRIRVEHMERQLANLTGLVQKALTHQTPATLQVPSTGRDSYRGDDYDYDMNMNSMSSSMQTLPDKSVSFEKSVSFSDEPPDMNSPKQHSPQHSADTKPTKPAIKSSTLPRTSSQERDRLKPAPPPKPASLSPGQYDGRHIYRDLQLTPEMYNQLRGLQKKAKDLRAEVRNLRRMSQAQAHSVRETIRDTFIKIRAMLMVGGEQVWQAGMDQERTRLSREEDLYKQEMIRLETDLGDLESTVEELRGNVINRKTRVNMSDVENMALVLSKSSKTVADLKLRFPMLQDGMKTMLGTEMEKVVREEKFLKEEPERLESALRRCKKLTGTLVTLKRLASVQEQRLPCSATAADGRLSPTEPTPITPTSAQHSKPVAGPRVGSLGIGGDSANSTDCHQRPENALDALLDELQTFSKPHTVNTQIPQVSYPPDSDPPSLPIKGIQPSHHHPPSMHEIGRKGSMDSATLLPTQTLTVSTATGSLRRLHSYPSGSDTDNSPPIQPIQRVQGEGKQSGKPPLPERNADLLQHISSKRVPPPPPPRTSSKSPLASPTSPSLPPRSPASNLQHIQNVQNMVENKPQSQFEAATQNLGLGTLRRNIQNRSSLKDSNKSATLPRNIGSNLQVHNTVEIETTAISASNSSSCESVNSQDGTKKRKEELEQRHQELLKKQKALQEQYARLQQLQRGTNTLAVIPPAPDQLLKKTGSESNILQKMGLQLTTSQMTGSLTNLPIKSNANQQNNNMTTGDDTSTSSNSSNTTNKVYETDIL